MTNLHADPFLLIKLNYVQMNPAMKRIADVLLSRRTESSRLTNWRAGHPQRRQQRHRDALCTDAGLRKLQGVLKLAPTVSSGKADSPRLGISQQSRHALRRRLS